MSTDITDYKRIKIEGMERDLDGVIEGIIVLEDIIERNRFDYREAWRKFLPEKDFAPYEQGVGLMSYTPIVSMRKCLPAYQEFSGKVRDVPYYLLVLNQARESRPKSESKPAEIKETFHCKLCENVLSREMIISEIGDYFLAPNGYPYHMFASLLIHKGENKKQGDLGVGDIETFMKTSVLLNQYVFYNSIGAGASIAEHQHAQVVDPAEIRTDNEIVPYPILNNSFVGREPVNGKRDVFRLRNYAFDSLIFTGRDAPYKANYAVHLIKSDNNAFNILINKNEVFVIGRNPSREKSVCIMRKVGGYELSGVALLGDIEEKSGEMNLNVKGAKIFSNMTYEILSANLRSATVNLDGVACHF